MNCAKLWGHLVCLIVRARDYGFFERRDRMPKQIWVRKGLEVRGPFSLAQVRQFAEEGKLTPLHEVSSDQKRWKVVADVPGLGPPVRQPAPPSPIPSESAAEGLKMAAASAGSQFALGVMLLVIIALMVAGACLLKLGLLHGLVFTLMFLLAAGLGYPAACFGRDVSAIYAIVMAVVCVILLGESSMQLGESLFSWLGFAAGLIPGALIILAWTLVAKGLGHDNKMADTARLNLSRFAAAPVSAKEWQRVVPALKESETPAAVGRVRLRLDPDDLDRAEESLGEVIEQEARRSVPGLAVSFVFHALLLLGFAIWQLKLSTDEDLTVEMGWKTISTREQTAVIPPDQRNLELQAVQINRPKPPEPEQKPALVPLNPGAGPVAPVSLVEVGNLFDGRSKENRQRIMEETSSNGPRIEQAISLGLGWLGRQQQSAGNWQLHTGYPDASEWPDMKTDTGATALALLAFLGNGQTHQEAKDKTTQEKVQKGLNWLIGIQNQNGNGDFHDLSAEKGRNPAFYAHSQATIVMCEAYAMTKDRKLLASAQKGVEYLLNSQQPNEGGWRYQPQDARSVGDLSVTGWVLMALHSARAAGIDVPEEQFQRASKFLNSVQDKNGARYRYQPTGWQVSRAMTAEGLLCRQFLGWPKNQPQLQEGLKFLSDEKYLPSWSEGKRNVYEWYYVGHLLHNMHNEEWTDWYDLAQKAIIAKQQGGGSGYRGSWHPTKPQGAPLRIRRQSGPALHHRHVLIDSGNARAASTHLPGLKWTSIPSDSLPLNRPKPGQ